MSDQERTDSIFALIIERILELHDEHGEVNADDNKLDLRRQLYDLTVRIASRDVYDLESLEAARTALISSAVRLGSFTANRMRVADTPKRELFIARLEDRVQKDADALIYAATIWGNM
jgi:hypothetical protein